MRNEKQVEQGQEPKVTVLEVQLQMIACGGLMSAFISAPSAPRVKLLLDGLIMLCNIVCVDLVAAVQWKMEANRLRYHKKKNSALEQDGVREMAKQAQVTEKKPRPPTIRRTLEKHKRRFWSGYASLSLNILAFARETEWEHLYTERSVAVSLYTEMGELAAVMEWLRPALLIEDALSLDSLISEIADVTIYIFHYIRVMGFQQAEVEFACVPPGNRRRMSH